jgi:hypothetical protein
MLFVLKLLGNSEVAYLKWCSTCDGPCGVRIDYEDEMTRVFMIGLIITEHLGLMDVNLTGSVNGFWLLEN